jgi:hypothetical protein
MEMEQARKAKGRERDAESADVERETDVTEGIFLYLAASILKN